jgi:hypothetical protein
LPADQTPPGCPGGEGLPYQFAAPLLNIKKIDACRMDSNHCLPDAGNGP